ncbi:hypothetical protein [Halobellus rufus]|uniref:hypothetical protein n=1 Tax=Halobellus rufus TaxID=1448860 RepID=UPI00067868A9|nr:hypothetical protein [Halobellus rufus]
MSTNVRHARPTRTDPQTDDGPDESGSRQTTESTPERPDRRETADAWIDCCQRQFDPAASDRLRNLVDEANLVVISPGSE